MTVAALRAFDSGWGWETDRYVEAHWDEYVDAARAGTVRAASVTSQAICLWMSLGWLRMSPGVRLQGGRPCEQRFISSLPKPITAPCGSLAHLATRSGTSAGTQLRFFQCTRWRSRAATWVSPMTPKRAAEV
jgi:hypothetical protein